MSKERQKARVARQAARAEEVARAAKARERSAKLERLKPSIPERRPKQRRFGALPTRVRLSLLLGWLGAQFLSFQVFSEGRTRFGFALFSLAALPIVVVLTRDPARRRRP